ncbi:Leo1-like protein-domain-containing protein [Hyaloraphidium curvatum]|nr:Leo1-like protein-domain-containing protein [Hyaloraphidium curvatum]
MENLFGSDDERSDAAKSETGRDADVPADVRTRTSPSSPTSPRRDVDGVPKDEDDDRNLFGSDDEESDASRRDDSEDLREDVQEEDGRDEFETGHIAAPPLTVAVPNVELPTDQQLFSARLPNYLQVEPEPFNEAEFRENLAGGDGEEDDEQLRIKLESTIRWRYNKQGLKDEQGGVIKESNARMIRWSDGSWSLLLGDEMFDVVLSTTQEEFQYLVATHKSEQLLQTQARFKEHMTFRPSGLQSSIHKKLTASIAAKHKKEAKTRLTDVDIDPEKAKEEAEKLEMELRKTNRKLQQRRRNYNRSLRTGDLDDDSDDDAYAAGNRNIARNLSQDAVEEDDEDDDSFIEDDEEEETRERERDQRLLKVKRGVDDRPKAKSTASMVKELDASSGSDSDDIGRQRKKRRTVLSDSDDE